MRELELVKGRIRGLQILAEKLEMDGGDLEKLTSTQRRWIREIKAGDLMEELQQQIAAWTLTGDEDFLDDAVTMMDIVRD